MDPSTVKAPFDPIKGFGESGVLLFNSSLLTADEKNQIVNDVGDRLRDEPRRPGVDLQDPHGHQVHRWNRPDGRGRRLHLQPGEGGRQGQPAGIRHRRGNRNRHRGDPTHHSLLHPAVHGGDAGHRPEEHLLRRFRGQPGRFGSVEVRPLHPGPAADPGTQRRLPRSQGEVRQGHPVADGIRRGARGGPVGAGRPRLRLPGTLLPAGPRFLADQPAHLRPPGDLPAVRDPRGLRGGGAERRQCGHQRPGDS